MDGTTTEFFGSILRSFFWFRDSLAFSHRDVFFFARSYELQYLERNPPQYYLVFIRALSLSVELEFGDVVFFRREESQPSRSNNKLNPHIIGPESNFVHIGRWRALSPLRHPCSSLRLRECFPRFFCRLLRHSRQWKEKREASRTLLVWFRIFLRLLQNFSEIFLWFRCNS